VHKSRACVLRCSGDLTGVTDHRRVADHADMAEQNKHDKTWNEAVSRDVRFVPPVAYTPPDKAGRALLKLLQEAVQQEVD